MMFNVRFDSHTLVLGQNQLPPDIPGEMTVREGTAERLANDAPPTGTGLGPIIWIMFLVLFAMIMFSILGQRRERKKREELIASVKKHDKVQTIGGVIGSIVELKPDFVVLKVDESSNTRITFARSAIQQVLKSSAVTNSGGKDSDE